MFPIQNYFAFGISPHLLYAESEKSELFHTAAVAKACALPDYETLEMFLPEDEALRKMEIEMVRDAGKRIHYNFPVIFQMDNEYNSGSANPQFRQNAFELACRNIDYAAQAGSPLLAITSCVDQGEAARADVLARFGEHCGRMADYAKQFGMIISIEALERDRFKKMLLGPTAETAAFVRSMQAAGHENVKIMMDTAHLPLMDEEFDSALALSLPAGIGHMHIGSSVMLPTSPYYGHKHPPIGIQNGSYDASDVSYFFYKLLECGYLTLTPGENRPIVSLEMLPYEGVSPETSARSAYEKICWAFEKAVARFQAKQ